jgi:hypothetical protein
VAIFTKTNFDANIDAYANYKDETTRVETDFVINSFKNSSKNYRLKTSNCTKHMTIQPSAEFPYIVVQPDDGVCAERVLDKAQQCYDQLLISPDTDHSVCDPDRNIEQAPFVLATKGIIFRQRSTPYFTTLGSPEGYIG